MSTFHFECLPPASLYSLGTWEASRAGRRLKELANVPILLLRLSGLALGHLGGITASSFTGLSIGIHACGEVLFKCEFLVRCPLVLTASVQGVR